VIYLYWLYKVFSGKQRSLSIHRKDICCVTNKVNGTTSMDLNFVPSHIPSLSMLDELCRN